MVYHQSIAFGLAIITTLGLSGCLSRKLAVMDLHDTLQAIAEELCDTSMKKDATGKVTLVTATGVTVGVDAATLGFPISASGNVNDSTQVEVELTPVCKDTAARLASRENRAVYTYDTWTGELAPRNDVAKDRERAAKERQKKK